MIIICHKERTSTTLFYENMKFLYKMTPFYLTQKPTNSIQFKKIKTIQKKKQYATQYDQIKYFMWV